MNQEWIEPAQASKLSPALGRCSAARIQRMAASSVSSLICMRRISSESAADAGCKLANSPRQSIAPDLNTRTDRRLQLNRTLGEHVAVHEQDEQKEQPGDGVGHHEAAPDGAHDAEQAHGQLVGQEHAEQVAEEPAQLAVFIRQLSCCMREGSSWQASKADRGSHLSALGAKPIV